ncbi:MAG: hypothetical protein IJ840_06170, partial [Bacteroidales bacterium]|nr:hypothetical protein [Bacteroidales bacterium]
LMGDFQSFSTTYFESYHDYFREVLSYPIYLLDRDSTLRFSRLEEVATMPAFPSPGCARMVGDVLVVRLSEDLDMKSSTDFQSSLSGDWRNQRL